MEQSSISPRSPGLVCTFYSYKGGVGRSMVLANIAAMLARWKQKVLVVDWDPRGARAGALLRKSPAKGARRV
jgi:MinD-like ATPase involved in chromosome partitioning or flagellar assembly